MDSREQALEGYERWFYGGSPPEGDAMTAPSQATEKPARAIGPECQCKRTAHTLLDRLHASLPSAALTF